jgi:hypothetical protein
MIYFLSHYLKYKTMSSAFASIQPGLGKGLSILGLVLSPFNTHYRRVYSGVLDYEQIAFIFSIKVASENPSFSQELGYSWLTFLPHIFP